jgi:hypothetical protein
VTHLPAFDARDIAGGCLGQQELLALAPVLLILLRGLA